MGSILGWFVGPIGKWVLLASALTVWTMGNRIDAARQARAEVTSEVLQARIESQQQRAEEAERIAEAARSRADATEAELAAIESETDGIVDQLDAAVGCTIPDGLLDRLRAIGGGPGE